MVIMGHRSSKSTFSANNGYLLHCPDNNHNFGDVQTCVPSTPIIQFPFKSNVFSTLIFKCIFIIIKSVGSDERHNMHRWLQLVDRN